MNRNTSCLVTCLGLQHAQRLDFLKNTCFYSQLYGSKQNCVLTFIFPLINNDFKSTNLFHNSVFLGINIGGGYKSNVGYNKSRQLPQFLAAGLPCDSPEHRAIASEYPTYKLDQNTVVDNSISWERCNPDGAVNCVPNGAGGPTCNNTSQISLSNRFVQILIQII